MEEILCYGKILTHPNSGSSPIMAASQGLIFSCFCGEGGAHDWDTSGLTRLNGRV